MCLEIGLFIAAPCRLPLASLIISIGLLCVGICLLICSRLGLLRAFKISGGTVRGKRAKLISTIVALWVMALSALRILSAVFGWGCPGAQ